MESSSSKLRLMCSYGGHIVPRPHDKSLFYADGETRIVSVDRRTATASLSTLSAHLSHSLFNDRPFHLKYQLPYEDLDSLISVITDEDLSNMLDEHDRTTAPARIRLFLFPVKSDSLLGPKSDSWFCDALKNTTILQSADSELRMAIGSDSEAPVEIGSKMSAESLVLETTSSFGSNGSSNSPVGISSSASIESENSIESAAFPPKTGIFQQHLIETGISSPIVQGGLQHVPQYPADPLANSPYYPLYQMPIPQQCIPCSTTQDQPYPIYLVPARPNQYHNYIDNNNPSSRAPLHQYNAVTIPAIAYKGARPVAESASKVYRNDPATTQIVGIPCNQAQKETGRSELKNPSEPVASVIPSSDFDEDFAYNQVYKTQPSRPVLPSQYQKMTKGTTIKLSESHRHPI
ncbi:hypothetical protein ACJIZ3_002306 [Penstemon smallii]|uniref:PB1 domain-containing protein n=1 Tax=Penstemon smallii TaxID=265156 RepID=A0ABD3U8V1_9LAMI